jgi:hypothetical protein
LPSQRPSIAASAADIAYLAAAATTADARMTYSNANSSCTLWPPEASVAATVCCRNAQSSASRAAMNATTRACASRDTLGVTSM